MPRPLPRHLTQHLILSIPHSIRILDRIKRNSTIRQNVAVKVSPPFGFLVLISLGRVTSSGENDAFHVVKVDDGFVSVGESGGEGGGEIGEGWIGGRGYMRVGVFGFVGRGDPVVGGG